MSELYITGVGQRVYVHELAQCHEGPCPIHRPSNHGMRQFQTCWRYDRGIMERICPHGVGHPDPDDRSGATVHGCDGCCHLTGEKDVS